MGFQEYNQAKTKFQKTDSKRHKIEETQDLLKRIFFLIFFFTLKFETLQGVAILRLIINCIVIFKKKCKYNKNY